MLVITRFLFAFILTLSMIVKVAGQTGDFKIVGYFGIDAAMKTSKSPVLKTLTHVNLWFLNPDSSGNFTKDLSALKPFIEAAHRKHVKVLFSIGGGSKHPQYQWLLKDENRSRLIVNLMDEVQKYDVDGLDVDLEGTDIHDTYESFVVELGTALHEKQKLLTAAVAIYYKDQFTDKALAQYDFMNVMSYDRTGPWRPDKPGPHSTYANAVEDLDYFAVERKVPASKLTLGVPFYGYGFGPELTSPAISMGYNDIVKQFKGAENTDELKMYDGKTLYYNGIPTIKQKTKLARQRASGIMIWQVLDDAEGSKSLLNAISKSAGGE
ncbi:MAG: glycosyl hydrolase family 18 protein [Chryseolinea sp.]